jgi:hypothetical protein
VILVTWPFHALFAVFKEVARQAEEALYDESALHAELMSLNARLERGEVTEEEFARRENELAERLVLAEAYHDRQRQAAG